jgi:hypothetical protein
MKSIGFLSVMIVVVGTGQILSSAHAQPARPYYGESDSQVLTRGPVHEAFAATISFDPEPGIIVNRPPPPPIEELPPEQRPEGANVAWIPGYTAWDDERDDFVWVSGVWRALPPGRQWVSGYWGRTSQGFQWVSGYWADAQLSEIEYLPEPPETMEVGPNMPIPSPNHSWSPGSWVWYQGRYAWRPGYWVTVQPDWDWIPAHYTWTPRGYVFVDGYWDYSIERRGVLFAPVYFKPGIYARRGYYYSPSVVINLGVFTNHLFVRPRYNHYYFGDYYDSRYSNAGFYSWFAYQSSRYGYDPIFVHERWRHRHDRDWGRRVEADFRYRRDNIQARPPRTLTAQISLSRTRQASRESNFVVAAPLEQAVRGNTYSTRFQAVDSREKQILSQRGREVQNFREERQKLETRVVSDRSAMVPGRELAPTRVTVPRSPIVGRRGDELAKDRAPPKRQEAPAPDPRVQGRPRRVSEKARAAESRDAPARETREQPRGKSKTKSKDD